MLFGGLEKSGPRDKMWIKGDRVASHRRILH